MTLLIDLLYDAVLIYVLTQVSRGIKINVVWWIFALSATPWMVVMHSSPFGPPVAGSTPVDVVTFAIVVACTLMLIGVLMVRILMWGINRIVDLVSWIDSAIDVVNRHHALTKNAGGPRG